MTRGTVNVRKRIPLHILFRALRAGVRSASKLWAVSGFLSDTLTVEGKNQFWGQLLFFVPYHQAKYTNPNCS